jgi:hypothetical protein
MAERGKAHNSRPTLVNRQSQESASSLLRHPKHASDRAYLRKYLCVQISCNHFSVNAPQGSLPLLVNGTKGGLYATMNAGPATASADTVNVNRVELASGGLLFAGRDAGIAGISIAQRYRQCCGILVWSNLSLNSRQLTSMAFATLVRERTPDVEPSRMVLSPIYRLCSALRISAGRSPMMT